MATRLYLANAAAPYVPSGYHGGWDDSASAATCLLGPKAGVSATSAVAEAVKATSHDVCLARFVSLPLTDAVTFTLNTTTVSWCIGILESDALANDYTHIHIWVTQGDSNTERGVLVTDRLMATEWPTSAAGRSPSSTQYVGATVNALAGDRIVVEFGYDGRSNSTNSYTGTVYYGTTGTDLTGTGDTNVTTRAGWLEFGNTFYTGIKRTSTAVTAALSARPGKTATLVTAALQGSVAVLQQSHFRIRSVDNQLLNADAGWAGALDADAFAVAETPFRIRFEVEETAGTSKACTFKAQYQKNAGGWVDLDAPGFPAATSTPAVAFYPSTYYTDGDATSDVLAGSARGFVAGSGETANNSATITLSNQHTEIEIAVLIRRLFDGRGQNDAGDTFQFRLVESDGTVFAGAYTTPTVTLTIATGQIGGVFAETPRRNGPFKDGNGNLYVLVTGAETDEYLMVMKSADGGDTWAPQDKANGPTNLDTESLDAFLENDRIYIAQQRHTVWHHVFRVSTEGANPDTWELIDEEVSASADAGSQAVSLIRRSDGDLVCFYTDWGPTYLNLFYRIKPNGGAWGSELVLDDAGTPNYFGVWACLAESDNIYAAYCSDDGPAWYRRLQADNTLDARVQIATGVCTFDPVGNRDGVLEPLYWDASGVEQVLFTYKLSANQRIWTRLLSDGVFADPVQASDNGVRTEASTGDCPATAVTLDPSTGQAHLIYADSATADIFRDVSSNGATAWGTDVEVRDSVTCDLVSARVYTHSAGNGGRKVLGYIWAAGTGGYTGDVWYGEVDLPQERTATGVTASLKATFARVATAAQAALRLRATRQAGQVQAALLGQSVRTTGLVMAVLSLLGSTARTAGLVTAALWQSLQRQATAVTGAISALGVREATGLEAALTLLGRRTLGGVTAVLSQLGVVAKTVGGVTAALSWQGARQASLATAALSRLGSRQATAVAGALSALAGRTAGLVQTALRLTASRTASAVMAVLSAAGIVRTASSVAAALSQRVGRSALQVTGALRGVLARTATLASAALGDFRDVDYIESGADPLNDVAEMLLTPIIDPQSSGGHILRVRYRKDVVSDRTVTLTVALYQGATEITTRIYADIPAVDWTQTDATLLAAEADTITNYSDLRVRLTATSAGVGTAVKCQVSWIELETTAGAAVINYRTASLVTAALAWRQVRTGSLVTAALRWSQGRTAALVTAVLATVGSRTGALVTAALSALGQRAAALVTAALSGQWSRTASLVMAVLSQAGAAVLSRTATLVTAALSSQASRTGTLLTAALSALASRTAALVTAVLTSAGARTASLVTAVITGRFQRTATLVTVVLSQLGLAVRSAGSVTVALWATLRRTASLVTAVIGQGGARTATLVTATLELVGRRTGALVTAALWWRTSRTAGDAMAALKGLAWRTGALVTATLVWGFERTLEVVTASLRLTGRRTAGAVMAVLASTVRYGPVQGLLSELVGNAGLLSEVRESEAALSEVRACQGVLTEVLA